MIAELPPLVRIAYSNMIVHFIYASSKPNLTDYFKLYSHQLTSLLQSGLFIDGTLYKIRLLCLIGDSPARSKLTYSIQYNGKNGCFNCLNQGFLLSKSKRIYFYEDSFNERSNEIYNYQVTQAQLTNEPFEGVKGSSYFSKFIKLPEHCLIDPMHAVLIGTVKHIFELLFDKKFSKKFFFHGEINILD